MEPTQSEEWRPVVGHEGAYEVSGLGRVRSLDRTLVNSRGQRVRYSGKMLRPRLSGPAGKKYLKVSLIDGAQGKIHHLVAEAFIGPRPAGMHVCHNDGDRFNNAASNLRYGTPSENNYDIVRHGRSHHANKTVCTSGHKLAEPNLVLGGKYGRQCRSCAAARAYVQRHPEADFAAEAERYYSRYWPTVRTA